MKELVNDVIHPAQAVFPFLKDEIRAIGRETKGSKMMIGSIKNALTLIGVKPYEYKVRRNQFNCVTVVIRSKNLSARFVKEVMDTLTGRDIIAVRLDPAFTPDP